MATGHASAPSIAEARPPIAIFGPLGARIERLLEAERAQLPLWLPVGLMLGIAAWFALPDAERWTAFLLLALGAGLGALALGAGTRWGRALALFVFAAALGCGLVWWRAERAAAPRLERAQSMEIVARVESVQALAAERRVRLLVAPIGEGLPARLRVNADEEQVVPGLAAGATVRLRAWLMPPPPMAVPGAYDFSRA
ncbi:MAG TPA: DUF4131 domain-containing protein, partial [Allosphingosinicella sp.]|nr:DUF4131 domain-containing protein [Allosphingosinicella sp.]